ncbi:hypothetical protein, conserved [Eimeria brunetti]|uniref:Uncharacterized protein n=1 Tax=Eimeria brunetti TaxID=51314 RepID=U6LBQ0_9EIME|nr:hypothetical protein, conserved [Eimeria brunetti]
MQQQQKQQREAIQEHLFQQALLEMQERDREKSFADFAERSSRVQEAMCQEKDPFLAEGRRDFVEGDTSLSPWLPRVATGSLGRNRDGFKGYPLEVKEAAEERNEEIREERRGDREREKEKQEQCDKKGEAKEKDGGGDSTGK